MRDGIATIKSHLDLYERMWRDDAGVVVSSELILLATIAVIGLLAGMAAVRDAVISELGDVAVAIQNINQSHSVDAAVGHNASTAGFGYRDESDGGDDFQRPGRSPAGIVTGQPEIDEGEPLPRRRP